MRLVPPPPSSTGTTKAMRANKGKNTKPEMNLRKCLRSVGLSGYRLSYKKAPGRPDICYPGKRLAIFVHGCFWHRCPKCNLPMPKSNIGYWKEKFRRNKERDQRKRRELEKDGWKVLEVWECQLRKNQIKIAKMIKAYHRESEVRR